MRIKAHVFALLLICTVFLFVACNGLWSRPAAQTITPDDLLGTWQADYSQYEVFNSHTFGFVSGIEQLSLSADGFYSQHFDDELVAQGKWDLDSEQVLRLHNARIFIYGEEAALKFAQADARAITFDCRSNEIELDGSELILCVRHGDSTSIFLQHLEVGDPDSPVRVSFKRISSSTISR